jgi:signal peptidase I
MTGLFDWFTLASAMLMLLSFAASLWMLLDAVRRDRGWVRWQVLFHFIGFFATLVWFFRRRRWPIVVELDGVQEVKYAAIAAGILVVSFTVPPAIAENLYQVARVEGQAMATTLNDQDRLVVNKWVYRLGEPAIGDIVMHRYPGDPEKSFVKRVVASSGDEVQIADGVVFRNGVQVNEPYVIGAHRSHDTWGPAVVPEGHYFVLGDHRNNSSDSRVWGYVPREYVLGRVTTRWWPLWAARRF